MNVVVHVPNSRLVRVRIVERIIELSVIVKVKISWYQARCSLTKVVTNNIEIDPLGRCRRDIGRLPKTTNRILYVRVHLRTAGAQPITEIVVRNLIEIDDVGPAAIDREIARAGRSDISMTRRGPTEQIL